MASSAPITQYRDQLIATFEEGKTWLRHTTVTEHQRSGNQAVDGRV